MSVSASWGTVNSKVKDAFLFFFCDGCYQGFDTYSIDGLAALGTIFPLGKMPEVVEAQWSSFRLAYWHSFWGLFPHTDAFTGVPSRLWWALEPGVVSLGVGFLSLCLCCRR